MNKKRGGQRKHWAARARVQAWYAEIKRRCDWSDYKLDYEFAWSESAQGLRDTSERPRMFEAIGSAAREPKGLDTRWRGMRDLVDAVGQHPQFAGTQALYEAGFWELFQESSPTPRATQARIDQLLKVHRLVRVPMDDALATGVLIQAHGLPSLYRRCVELSMRQMDRFSRITLAWLLYLQTEPAHSQRFRAEMEAIVDTLLDHFFADFLPEEHWLYYDEAIDALFHTRLDLSSQAISGYGYLETLGTWPVVPQDLVGTLTERHLLPELAW